MNNVMKRTTQTAVIPDIPHPRGAPPRPQTLQGLATAPLTTPTPLTVPSPHLDMQPSLGLANQAQALSANPPWSSSGLTNTLQTPAGTHQQQSLSALGQHPSGGHRCPSPDVAIAIPRPPSEVPSRSISPISSAFDALLSRLLPAIRTPRQDLWQAFVTAAHLGGKDGRVSGRRSDGNGSEAIHFCLSRSLANSPPIIDFSPSSIQSLLLRLDSGQKQRAGERASVFDRIWTEARNQSTHGAGVVIQHPLPPGPSGTAAPPYRGMVQLKHCVVGSSGEHAAVLVSGLTN